MATEKNSHERYFSCNFDQEGKRSSDISHTNDKRDRMPLQPLNVRAYLHLNRGIMERVHVSIDPNYRYLTKRAVALSSYLS